jgi:hypothetical protein
MHHRQSATSRSIPQSPGQQARLALGVQIGQQYGEGLTYQPATIHGNPVSAKREPGPLEVEKLGGGQVNRDLLGVSFAPAGLPPVPGRRAWCVRARRGRPE